jgi:bifunctional UDP-N-acetylglucosamine pyrophosphorylase/glucosamine-1-phosphate N-acetyltransferase
MSAPTHAALVLAAGKGTRMKSPRAKVLHEAAGLPLVAWPIDAALALACGPIVVVVGHQAAAVEAEVLRCFPQAPLAFALQAEQRGTTPCCRPGARSRATRVAC